MERLSGLDASFLYLETRNIHMHVLAVIEFDPSTAPGGYSFDKVKDMIRSRLHLAPPLRRRLAFVPFRLGHPVWVEDPDFDLDYHVRRIGCPAPGGPEELADIAADIASRKLDQTRPLWEVWVVEGLRDGRVAAVAKMHHSTIDGVSGANLMVHFFDLAPEGTPRPEPDGEWRSDRVPSDVELAAGAILSRATRPMQWVRMVPRTARAVRDFALTRLRMEGPGMAAPLRAPRTIYNTAITPHRQVAFARIGLDRVKALKNQHGTTVNDVVLAVCAGALRLHLDRHGAVPRKSLSAVVPVSVRDDSDGEGSNRVSAMFTTLATDVDDPLERLRRIHEVNKGAKEEHHAIGADMLQKWAEFAAPTTFSLAARAYSAMRLAERHPVAYNLVVSNVPGPSIPLYFAGSQLVALYPLGPIFDGMALNVTVVSYRDGLYWGLLSCRETVPDLWDLAVAIPEALEELERASRPKKRASSKRPAGAARKKTPSRSRPRPRKAAAS